MSNFVITIGRQSGTGGREIGMKLAKKLGIKCYDKELITRAAKESGLAEEIIDTHDEKPNKSFLYSLVMDSYEMGFGAGYTDIPLSHKVFLAQLNAIKQIADEESCVIVGRCADYALEGRENLIRIFVTGEEECKITRLEGTYGLNTEDAKALMKKKDKERSSYYNYYSNKEWGKADSYDLCISSTLLGVDGTVESLYVIIKQYLGEKGIEI
jgi:CMP/dCMP kinase